MLGEVTTFLLGIILAVNATQDVFTFHTQKMTWMDARAVCSRAGGFVTSDYNQEDFIDLIKDVRDPVWIWNYYSPWVWLLGCYSYTESRDYIEFKANQMKECLNHCHKTNYFGLQKERCFCFDTFKASPLKTSRKCKYECPGNNDERCGGEDAITIYMNDICYENSAEWQGTVSQTWSGKQCLPWASIEDVKKRRVQYFPDGNAENAANFCRNPFGLSHRPWCYISETESEDCDIPPCIDAAEDGIYPCMSFKRPIHRIFQFTQDDCQSEHFAICTYDDKLFWGHNRGTWQNARDKSRRITYSPTTKCGSLAGPQIFRLSREEDVDDSQWFGFFREICTDSETIPNKKPTKCFSVSNKGGNNTLKVEDCGNRNHFICQYMAVTCGDTFNTSLNGSFETPGYNNAVGYGDFQRCVWKIIVPENHNISLFLDILIEDTYNCSSDILKVFEESYETGVYFCGETTETINTTGNHVTVEFKSDGTANDFRGVQVKWYAVSVPTLPPTTSTSTFTMTTEQPSTTTNQAIEITTFQQFKAESGSNSKTLAGGTVVGIIVGILIGLCLVLGIVLFWVKRKKASKNKESKVNGELDSTEKDENMPAIRSGRCNSGNSERPSSEIYHNAVTENENLDYSLPNNVGVREKAVVMNSVSVSYQKKNGKDGCDRQTGGNSDVYNTLHETTENVYQNHTENVYNYFNDSTDAFDNASNLARQGKADAENVYNHLNDSKKAFGKNATLTRQGKADAENVYNNLNDSEETYDHTTVLTRQGKACATVASNIQTYGYLRDVNESTYDVTSM